MRSVPFLALTGVLGVLLTACPGGPTISFTGTYIGTLDLGPRAVPLPEAWRGATTLTAVLTQTGMSVSGTLTPTPPGPPGATISAMVTAPGEATGMLTPPPPPPPPPRERGGPQPIRLSLTVQRDLVLSDPNGAFALFLERQP